MDFEKQDGNVSSKCHSEGQTMSNIIMYIYTYSKLLIVGIFHNHAFRRMLMQNFLSQVLLIKCKHASTVRRNS